MTPETFFDNFSHLAEAPNGVKKLRELILQMAVQGKLVPQDSSDEPAAKLLEQIQAEKARLVKEKKIRKSDSLPSVTTDEAPYVLPQGWKWVRLGELGITQTGTTPKTGDSESFGRDYPFIKPADIYPNEVNYDNEGLSEAGVKKYGRVAPANTVLMVCIGTIGKSNIIERPCSFNQQINAITPYKGVNPYYLKHGMRAQPFQELAWEYSNSTTIAILNKSRWESICFPLPPLAEQERIVVKVDQLMALCDKLEAKQQRTRVKLNLLNNAALDRLTSASAADDFTVAWHLLRDNFDLLYTTPETIAKLRQSILQLAVQGKLVAQDPNDEPASVLLAKIKTEKERLVKEKKIRKSDPLPPVSADEVPYELPQGWEWVRLGNAILKLTDGTHHSPANFNSGEFKYVTAKNIKKEGIILGDITYVSKEVHDEIYSRCNPEFGDILYIKDGATTGIATINQLTEPFSMLSSVALLKLPAGISNRFMLQVLRSPFFYALMREGMTGVAITRVTLSKLGNAMIPLPTTDEQHRIVTKIDRLMALCDEIESRITKSQSKAEKLAVAAIQGLLAC